MSDHRDDSEVLDLLATYGAEAAAPTAVAGGVPSASTTSAIVRTALECLVGNGLVTVTPHGDWPDHVVLDRPYGRWDPHGSDLLPNTRMIVPDDVR